LITDMADSLKLRMLITDATDSLALRMLITVASDSLALRVTFPILADSMAALEGRVLSPSVVGDSIARLEADVRDTVLVVVGGFIADTLGQLRSEMSDTSLAYANIVRGEARDSATVVWNDSATVIIRMPQFVDSLTALEDRIAADSLTVLRGEMPDSAARVVADSAATMRTYVQNTIEDSLPEVRSLIYTVVTDTAGALRTFAQDAAGDSASAYAASKLDTSDVAVAGGATKGWNGTTLTITAASNSGIGDSLSRADSTHNKVWIATLATDSTWSGTTYRYTVGETVTWNKTLYMKSDGKLYLAKADTTLTMMVVGIALQNGSANQSILVLEEGFVCDTSFAWTPGQRVYPSAATAGAMSTTPVSSAANVSQILGVGWAADVLKFKPSLVEAVK
jgi:hypothetical protein